MSEERHCKGNRVDRRDRAPRDREGEGDFWPDSSSVGNREDKRDGATREERRVRAPREGEEGNRKDRRDRLPRRERRDREQGGDFWSETSSVGRDRVPREGQITCVSELLPTGWTNKAGIFCAS